MDSESPAPGIHAAHLRRFFGPVPAVVDISLDAPSGAITGLIGPNGAGKTTLLLILAGLLSPDSGQATVGGYDIVTHPRDARAVIGWMPDAFGTWDALTCAEILTFYCRAYGLPKREATHRTYSLLETVYLAEYAGTQARVLSRGQKQRLGLARALVHDPAVLLLDEPASGLDPRSRIELRDLLKSFAAAGKTVLLSSHVLSEMDEIVDNAVFLSSGRDVDQAAADRAMVTRGWRIGTLEPARLTAYLDEKRIGWQAGVNDEVSVQLVSPEVASILLRDLMTAGIDVHTFAPTSGRLEEAYLALNEERR